jgi:shikimate dehydrogenase
MRSRYALIGNPVAHSRSPSIHVAFARDARQDLDYGLIEAPLDGFERAVAKFRREGGLGLNVTVPFKENAFRICDRLSDRARVAQAVNTLVFAADVYGDNTDGIGLVLDLKSNVNFDPRGKSVLLMGAGGAAQGVAGPLVEAGVGRLVIANRTVERARALAARFPQAAGCGFDALGVERFDLVVNATSTGVGGEDFPLPPFRPGMLAYDMAYGRDTAFLVAARAAGARAVDGLGMLVEQAAESFHIWRGVRPQTGGVLRRLRGE